jgi:hypothetical protein
VPSVSLALTIVLTRLARVSLDVAR